MKPNLNDDLTGIVNASGFAFQLAVEHQIRESKNEHHWEPILREHPWQSDAGLSGFIDLILQESQRVFHAIVECKRTKDAKWVFLVPEDKFEETNRFCFPWADGRDGNKIYAGWDDLRCGPPSFEAQFCTVRGQGEGQVSMLERIASELLRSVDALANEEIRANNLYTFVKGTHPQGRGMSDEKLERVAWALGYRLELVPDDGVVVSRQTLHDLKSQASAVLKTIDTFLKD